MKIHLENAAYGVLDYAAYPVGMLLVAPVALHKLGIPEYGVWTLATAAVSTGGIIASGFGDANIQHVASHRSSADKRALASAVRSMMAINLTLGVLLALTGWLLAPDAAQHIAASDPALQRPCLLALRIASLLMLVRALESVSISTLRAFERYGAAVRISIAVRLLTLAIAAMLASSGRGTVSIMEATAVLMALGTCAQFYRLHRFLGSFSLWPLFHRSATTALFGFGIFSWLQAIAGVIFGQIDRLLLGVSLGAAAVASYALCIQLALPIFGLTAAGLHFLFPYLAGRVSHISTREFKRTLTWAFAANLLIVSTSAALLLLFGDRVLHAWAGAAVARAAAPVFPLIVVGSSLLGLSVTGTYTMLALGRVRTVASFSIAGGATMLAAMWWLLPGDGVHGLAIARLFYGFVSLLLYLPLIRAVGARRLIAARTPALSELQEATPL